MISDPFNSPGKKTVREAWDTPLLDHLSTELSIKYHYFGFPGPEMHDINLWRHLITEVTAFEVDDSVKPGTSEPSPLARLGVNLHRSRLPHKVFFGSFENVVTLGQDNLGQAYTHDRVVTLVNLDFTNQIDSKIGTPTGKKVMRFEAIRTFLSSQKTAYDKDQSNNWFVLLLTFRDQMNYTQMKSAVENPFSSQSTDYVNACIADGAPTLNVTGGSGKYPWVIKTATTDWLTGWFAGNNISAYFLPFVRYLGGSASSTPMLHQALICKFGNPQHAMPDVLPQRHLFRSSIRADGSGLQWEKLPGEVAAQGTPKALPHCIAAEQFLR